MELHLPGPPLAEWLVYRFRDARMAFWSGPEAGRGRVGRALRATLQAVGGRLGWTAPEGGGFDGLVVMTALAEGSDLPATALAAVRPGGWLVEAGHPPPVPLWRPSRWGSRARIVRRAAEIRAGVWLGRGCYEVELWAPVDLPRVLVTCARVRAVARR